MAIRRTKKIIFLIIFLLKMLLFATISVAQSLEIRVKNDLNFYRNEVVSIPKKQISKFLRKHSKKTIRIKREGTEAYLPMQWIDTDYDGEVDALLFQAQVNANTYTNYLMIPDTLKKYPKSERKAYARFVPERSDDFAWENDRVAFRAYGPKGQKEALQGVQGSTLSSGIDIWLKSVDYSIIDKWYKKNQESPGYYHTDHGEGYDPYHVGSSRGLGGTGIWKKDSLKVSGNFSTYKILADGPLRTVFDLVYAPWGKDGIEETKRITLEMGSNFSKIEIYLTAEARATNYAIGLTLHDNRGASKINTKKGWMRYWEPIDDSFVGEGIVLAPSMIASAFTHVPNIPDQNHLIAVLKPADRYTYYAGFTWKKNKQALNASEWDMLLDEQALIITTPLKIVVGKETKK